jgi:transcriptional regulator with XRE-family HTH domain
MRYFTTYLVQQVSLMGALLLTFLFSIWHELRDKRQREGLSIERAAEICDVDPSTYARWERGKQYPHPRNLNMLRKKIDLYDEVWFAEMSYVPDEWLPPSYWND